ncbi:MAG: substrate-binding domain-containing protein [Candidatus Hodarchaeota archaeon]
MVSPTQTKAIIVIVMVAVLGVSTTFAIVEFSRQSGRLILATTTSTYDSGLLDEIIPAFEQRWGAQVDIVSVGTGQALAMGRSGDCDVLMVHSRSREDAFVNEGCGIHRVTVWWNDFVIVGPPADPANINGLENATEAFIRIYNGGEAGNSTFYSRGDESGTESKEVAIWQTTGLGRPENNTQLWYKKTGQGMGSTLIIANEKDGYTLSDRGTWLSRMDELTFLTLQAENDTILLNPYGVILVDPGRFPNVNLNLAVKFVAYLCSPETQAAVDAFRKNNQPMFHSCYGTGNETSLLFDTNEQVQEQVNYWDPLIQLYYP